MVGYRKGAGPLDQSFQIAACMTLVALIRKVEVQRMMMDRAYVQAGLGVEVVPAAGRRRMTAWAAEEQEVLAEQADNETPDDQQAVVEEQDLPIVAAPCKGEEGDREGGVHDVGVGPLKKVVVYQAIAVLAETAVVEAPEMIDCELKTTQRSPHQDEASPYWTVLLQLPACCAIPVPHVEPTKKTNPLKHKLKHSQRFSLTRFSNQ